MPEFTVNGERYQMSDDGRIRWQLGKKDKSGKIRYLPHSSYSSREIARCFLYFKGLNVGYGYCKRLSYKPSEHSSWYELVKVVS